MTAFAYFNEYGDCLYVIDSVEAPGGGVEVDRDTDPNSIWYDAGAEEIIQRQPSPITFQPTYMAGEPIDFMVPAGAVVLIDGVRVSGQVVFDEAKEVTVQVTGRYYHDQSIRIVTLAGLREQRWNEARAYREQRQDGGCATPWGVVDTDEGSRLKISGAVQMAMLAQMSGEPYAIDWTMADNSQQGLDAAAMISLGVTVGQHVAACHAAGTAIRTAIEAAADETALAAIDITAGYP